VKPKRQYIAYSNHKPLLLDINQDKITAWIGEKIFQIDSYSMQLT